MLKLYTHPYSTFARRVEIALREKGIEAERIVVDLAQRAHKQPSYLALHPFGRVPTLVNGDFVLPESTPILEYLEAIHPEPSLSPSTVEGRALMAMHMKLCDLELTSQVYPMVFSKRFLPKEKWRVEEMERGKEPAARYLKVLDGQLEGKTYLIEERFTLADLCHIPWLHFIDLLEVDVPANVQRWAETLLARPSVLATVPDV